MIKYLAEFIVCLTPSTEAAFTLRVCDKHRAAIRKNAQCKSRPAPNGRVLVLMVMEPKQALDKERVKKLTALAPVNIIAAEFGSELSYWQPTMRSTFFDLLTNSTGTKLRIFDARKTLSGCLFGTNFPKRYQTRSRNFQSE